MFILSLPDMEAAGICYIPWPTKKIAAQNSYASLSARNSQKLCSLHSQLAKAAKKKKLQTNKWYVTVIVDPFRSVLCKSLIREG